MKLGPKYKICRRLGTGVFEKCQTQKYVLSEAKKSRTQGRRRRPRSDFGLQLIEKQKVRLTYGLSEKQFSNYVKQAVDKRTENTAEVLVQILESRLDNVIYRLGLASTRAFARQMVSHGHIYVNGRKVTVPSYSINQNDVVSVKESSRAKGLFVDLEERLQDYNPPAWLSFNLGKKEAKVQGSPKSEGEEIFDLPAVIQFYSR